MTGYSDQSEHLSAFLDGELPADKTVEVQQLLDSSVAVREELGELEHASRLVRALPSQTAPPEFSSAVMARIERESLLPRPAPVPALSTARNWVVTVGTIVSTIAVMVIVIRSPELVGVADPDSNEIHPSVTDAMTQPSGTPASETIGSNSGGGVADQQGFTSGVQIPANVEVGDIIRHARDSGGRVAIVELTVVDVAESIDRLEVLLMDGTGTTNAVHTPLPNRAVAENADPEQDGMYGLYVERDSTALTAVLSKFFSDESVRILDADSADSNSLEVAAIGEEQAKAVARLELVLKGLGRLPDSESLTAGTKQPTTTGLGAGGESVALHERPLRVLARKRAASADLNSPGRSTEKSPDPDPDQDKTGTDAKDPLIAANGSAPLRVLFVFQNPGTAPH